jgi:transketolase
MDAVEAANSGHPGAPMGLADVATVLFSRFLKFDPTHPSWPDRDRFVLSGGHGSMLQYALMYLCGYPDMTLDQIRNFRQLGSKTAGHPEYGLAAGIETTTGPLGQGFANAVGMALAERILADRFGDKLVDHRTWVLCGDGDLMEGISHEAASLAGHLKLSKLIVFYDDNKISIDGSTDLASSDNVLQRFLSYGWQAVEADGHDPESIIAAVESVLDADRPALIACKTVIGYGAPNKAGTAASHGAPLGKEEIAATRSSLEWPYPPFEIPAEIKDAWREVGGRCAGVREAWRGRLASEEEDIRNEFNRVTSGALPDGWDAAILNIKEQFAKDKPEKATRESSGMVIEALLPYVPEILGGSADLTGSNNTRAANMTAISPNNFGGRYLHYGVRELGMAAAMNGLALHGGVIPYSGTFLIFSDYARPAMRLSALMKQRIIYVMTHDSIGLGEDGPTHQPVEQLAALRAMPNLFVMRPADPVEVAECWEIAVKASSTPSVLALTRQKVPFLRSDVSLRNLSEYGAYVISPGEGDVQAVILASGSEVAIGIEAQKILLAQNIIASVVSVPCMELFLSQSRAYQEQVLGLGKVRIAVEAGVALGWERLIGPNGGFVGMSGFGASGPAGELFKHFGITAESVVDAVVTRL